MERYQPSAKAEKISGGGNYFASKKDLEFISSGCKVLDLALGGGWAERRIGNAVGDKSSGKTLLMIEAAANFSIKYPEKGRIRYREAESAFDPEYARALGMPTRQVDWGDPIETVEDLFEDLDRVIKKNKGPELYILDSLDALSDRAEMERDMDQGSYGAEKAKKMSQLFRRLTSQMADANLTLLIVSQIRDKMNVSFGKKTTRSGGRAMDFYCSQVLELAQLGTEKRTIGGIERPTGLKIRGKVTKNKVALPFREAGFEISFGYGINDVKASLDWLKEVKSLSDIGIAESTNVKKYVRSLDDLDDEQYAKTVRKINRVVEARWYEIEESFMPTRRKYA